MLLRVLVARRLRARQIPLLAADVARRSRGEVWQRVGHRASTMVLAEARGYIRARAAGAIAVHLRQATGSGDWSAGEVERLRRASLDHVVRLVLGEMLHRRPLPDVVRRAA